MLTYQIIYLILSVLGLLINIIGQAILITKSVTVKQKTVPEFIGYLLISGIVVFIVINTGAFSKILG